MGRAGRPKGVKNGEGRGRNPRPVKGKPAITQDEIMIYMEQNKGFKFSDFNLSITLKVQIKSLRPQLMRMVFDGRIRTEVRGSRTLYWIPIDGDGLMAKCRGPVEFKPLNREYIKNMQAAIDKCRERALA